MRPPDLPVTRIKNIHFKNPFAVTAKATTVTNPNGRVTPDVLMYYKRLAQSEAALVVTGPATVSPPSSRKYSLLRADQPKYMDGLRALSKIIHANGAIPGIQVAHMGPFEANDLLAGIDDFGANLDDYPDRKLLTAYNNAAKRSVEVGFRYVEMMGGGNLLLHQLIAEDKRELVEGIFVETIKGVGQGAVLALRLQRDDEHHRGYGTAFLEAGGDLVCYSESSGAVDIHPGHLVHNLEQPLAGARVRELVGQVALFGLKPEFKGKPQQIMAYFRG